MGESGGRVQQQRQPATEPQGPHAFGRPAREVARGKAATAAAQGQGVPLQPGVRREFEHRLGHDFGAVRVHTGNEAERATAALGASGFTLGRNVVLGGGVSDQASPVGRRILAHELRHVVQQAGFLDRDLGGAPVLDASHPSEHEARSETGPLTPLAGPAVQLGPPDLIEVAKHFVVDLTRKDWKETIEAATEGSKDVLYVLRETSIETTEREGELVESWVTNVFRKAGKTELGEKILIRFQEYRGAALDLGKRLYADVYTFDKGSETAETVEAEARAGLEKMGARLPWDNTRIKGRGPRLGRRGQGIPKSNPDAQVELIDEGEQVRVKPPPQKIPPRRGTSSKQKAKLKAASEKAAGTEAEQSAKAAGTEATEQTEAKAAQSVKKAMKVKSPTKRAAKPKLPAEAEQSAKAAGTEATEQTEAKAAQGVKKAKKVKPPAKRAAKPKPAEPEPKAAEKAEGPPVEEKPPAPTGQAGEAGGDVTEQATKKVATETAGATETVAADVADKTVAEGAKASAQVAAEASAGTLTAGVVGTALEVVSNPALMFGWMVVEGISGDYQAAWEDIRAPARVRGFAQGMAARFAGLDGHAALMMITPDFVHATMGATIVGAEGMEEQALVDGAREGWKYVDGYSTERRKRELDHAAARLRAQGGPELEYDVDGQITRQSLRNVAETLLPQARNAIARWDALREKRERKKKAEQLRELAKYDPLSSGQLRAVANALDPERGE